LWQKFSDASLENRSRYSLSETTRPYARRPTFSRDELLSYLRDNRITTRNHLRKCRSPQDPLLYDYTKIFGKWSIAVNEAYKEIPRPEKAKGPPIAVSNQEFDEYLAKLVTQFNLWTVRAYYTARKKRPDVIPPFYVVLRQFQSFSRLIFMAKQFSLGENIDKYRVLKRILGKWPTLPECKAHRIDLSKALSFFNTKRQLDEYLERAEKAKKNEK
jgi:hypothetical protein